MTAQRLLLALWMVTGCASSTPEGQTPAPLATAEEGAVDPRSDCSTEDVCTSRCNEGDLGACEWLGRMHETGEGATQDYKQAADFYGRACDAGRADSCAHLAMMYDIGVAAGGESAERARELYDKACSGGNRWACKRVAQLDR